MVSERNFQSGIELPKKKKKRRVKRWVQTAVKEPLETCSLPELCIYNQRLPFHLIHPFPSVIASRKMNFFLKFFQRP